MSGPAAGRAQAQKALSRSAILKNMLMQVVRAGLPREEAQRCLPKNTDGQRRVLRLCSYLCHFCSQLLLKPHSFYAVLIVMKIKKATDYRILSIMIHLIHILRNDHLPIRSIHYLQLCHLLYTVTTPYPFLLYIPQSYSLVSHSFFYPHTNCDLMIFKGNISCYILLIKSPLTLDNTKFVAGEPSLKVSLVLYLPTGHYEL